MVELLNLLKTLGLPVTYHHFKTSTTNPPPTPPYIIYLYSYSDNFGADNKVYDKGDNYQVELYSIKKDLAREKLIEDLFDNNDIFYEKTETYIDSEGLYQVLYEIQM
jgi:hypothetical protein